ncbi:ESX secretion-associated protein EspG [Actinokineospora globicatena]|uniref:ESX secretion-associated protein EspG n=1 Tax=Actinokineospora globicatena TaxID=103729 RepID=UPI0020A5FC2C|nr:ESX secretion-associated protein EspG [Actinokineospora globicatena]MCP2301070.1 EspG family protein [Actinokineospora globicatena]GLW77295.1 ESX secretion-associated protein EspG [Actinokineospora globicatena]GLW84129.1 ESX secretion-associated protein EspG [Actinokineospora globicatena]
MKIASLTLVEFDLLWESLGRSDRPYPLDVPSFGETTDERDQLRKEVVEGLVARGLHDGADVDRELEDSLTLLAQHDYSVDGLLSVGRHVRVLGAGRGSRTALAVQTGERIRIGQLRGGGVVAEIMALLPDAEPGPGTAVTLRKSVFHDAIDAYVETGFGGLETVLNQGGLTGRDMRTIATLVENSRHGGGQVAANSLDRVGRRTRTDVVNWFDTTAGRYLALPTRRDGVDWLTLAPADAPRLTQRLRELVASVAPR